MSKLNIGQNVGYTKSKNDSIPENYPNTIVEAVYWDEKKKPLNEVLSDSASKTEELEDKKLNAPVAAGSAGQVLALDANGKPAWVNAATGGTYDGALSDSSTNAPQNKVVTAELTALGQKVDKLDAQINTREIYTATAQTLATGTELFTMADVFEGQVLDLFLKINDASNKACFLDFLNTSNQRIEYFGRGSNSTVTEYSGTFTVPANFSKCVYKQSASPEHSVDISVTGQPGLSEQFAAFKTEAELRLDGIDDIIESKVYRERETIVSGAFNVTAGNTTTEDISSGFPNRAGKYICNVSNGAGSISCYRLLAYDNNNNGTLLLDENETLGKIGNDLVFTLSETLVQAGISKFRISIGNPAWALSSGTILYSLDTMPYDIQQDIAALQNPEIMFPVPEDIYCAVGTDMNLYYENMFGMLDGSGYMFIDTPGVVYDTSDEDSGDYDNFCNFERQLHFKPNEEGDMTLYLNVWNEYMKQLASKTTTLHIVDPAIVNGKTLNILVNGSSSIDMGYFQSEIKKMLEDNGATINLVGRWASGNDYAATAYNNKALNRLSENRSGGSSSVYTTKSNGTTTKIAHPTNITDFFYSHDAIVEDGNGNRWEVWGNSPEFVELVLSSGTFSNIPASGTMTKVSGHGPDSFTYDSLITSVPQTTNPFWDDSLNNGAGGVSFASFCSNWNRNTPDIFLTLWGTNDIGGSAGNIDTGKQWATDAQINTFVNRQKILVDAFTRDCPSGVVVMCPQPTGSLATGKKNSDRNGMLFSKLKATQALMDAFADYSNVIIVPVLWWFDRWWSYNIYKRTLSARMEEYYGDTKLDDVSDDTTHPEPRGYFQMADAAFSAIVAWVKANE